MQRLVTPSTRMGSRFRPQAQVPIPRRGLVHAAPLHQNGRGTSGVNETSRSVGPLRQPAQMNPRQSVLLPTVVLLAGLAVTATGMWWLDSSTEAEARGEFDRVVLRDAREISERFRTPVYGLNGARGVYATHAEVRRDSFRRYVASRNMDTEFPGVRGFGFIQRVERSDLPAFIDAERADEAPDFGLRQLTQRDEPDLFVIKIIEPVARNAAALGLDVGSDPVRRQGAVQAIATGEPTTTGIVTLLQDERRTPGVLLYVPLFATVPDGAAPGTRGELRGLLYAPIVISELLAGLADVEAGRVHIQLFDTSSGTATGPQMYDSAAWRPQSAASAQPRFDVLRTIDIPGRVVTMRVQSTPAFEASYGSSTAWLFGLGGLFASGLLAALMRQQITGRSRAEQLAQQMTRELQRLALVARRTSNAVVITDAQRRITWVNEGFERITGYRLEEVIGLSPGSFLQFEGTDTGVVQALRTALDAGEGFRGELLNRSKQGQNYWVDLDIQPLHDAHGVLTGFMAIETEITARKEAEMGLARERKSLQNILEGTQVGTWEWNVETGRTVFNERWAQIVGRTLAELGPTSIQTWADLTHPEDLKQSSLALQRHFDGLSEAYECEARMRHRDGHWVWVLDRGKLFTRSEDGRPRWMAGTHMDITERKQAEAALRAGQALLSQTGRIGGVGGWELDVATQALSWTDQTCRIHDLPPGHRPTLVEAIGYYTPEARPLVQRALAQSMEFGERWDLELPMVTAGGRSIWVRAVGEPELVDGKPVRLLGAFQDITGRRALEAELRAKNDLVSSVIESLPCGLSVFDGDLQLVASNREFRRLLDYPDSLLDSPRVRFEDLVRFSAERGDYGPGDIETTVQEILDAAHRPMQAQHFDRLRPDGKPLEVRGAPMPGGGFVTTFTDVSARMAAEAEVQRSANLLRGAIDAIDEAFVLYDPEDRLVFCNDKYRQIYPSVAHLMVPGATFEELVRPGAEAGEYLEAVGRVDDWVAERVAAHRSANTTLVQKLSTGRTLRIVERKMADGHIVGFRIDVTELARATEAAETASLAKSQFLANMSHEIRTPMNAILGMLTLLRRTELNPRQADYAVKTEGAARSLLGLLNDILDFSKVEAGKMTLDPNPFRVDQLMRDLGVVLSASMGTKPVEILFDIDPALPRTLVGDAMRLQQVLINLGGNAIKFTDQGEVVLSVRVLHRQGNAVTLRVAMRDTGIGIAPENQARIFSGFTQAEASTTRRYGGSGLGVTISQRLVRLMGGELQLDSALGKGSTFHFTLTLPVAGSSDVINASDASDSLDDNADAGAAAPAGLRALVVDDNPTARELLRHMSESLGWTVDLAAGGEEALALLAACRDAGGRYDVVFIDWQMPGLDGWQTAGRIREGGLVDGAPVVVMVTAHGREQLEQRSCAEQATLDAFLVKPVTASMLLDAVVDARQRRELPHLSLPARPATAGPRQRLAGMRLLLTEDNRNNQQVARELLEDEGAIVQLANNGLEGVEAVAAADPPFDLVLMDVQMPVMDGFTATARIRQDLMRTELPIVAMTANAMATDREACLAAGMNEHVDKPFDIDRLVAVLRRLTGRSNSGPSDAGAAVAAGPGSHSIGLPDSLQAAATAAGVELAPALQRMGGKQAVYARMLQTTLHDFRGLAASLQRPLADAEGAEAARSLHTLKGLGATLGITALAQSAADAEKLFLTAPPAPEAMARCAAVGAALDAALPALATLAERLRESEAASASNVAGAAPAPIDHTALHHRLAELATLLEQSDMRATELASALRQPASDPLRPLLDQLDDAVCALDFERATPLCRQLLLETQA
jgi:two-component system, sensor histidine kinase and response regulator